MLVVLLASITIISASSYSINEAMAFPHASIIIDESDEDNINPIELVLGHTNEPAFGKKPGIHDGKHNVEVILEDARTALPIQGSGTESSTNGENGENGESGEDPTNNGQNGENQPFQSIEDPEAIPPTSLTVDKFYFRDIESFQSAQSPYNADAVETDAPLTPVFGQPGEYVNRQVIDAGIYGYRIQGVINYYNQGIVPVDVTKFCGIAGEDLTKFDRPQGEWQGSFGCPENIKDIFFPPSDSGKYPYPQKYDDGYGEDNRERPY
jgi:hypothetical protein